ncbi:MAG: hypothetical protein E6J40_05915 [Chloroflexi bacterium]|nr:MAG: hypothetical protein E6J40_05915 [Chloroflexota bacterium]
MDLKDDTEGPNPPAQPIPMANGQPPLSVVAREDLLADFGHQLRNELNAIVSAASMLSATATTSEQRELSAIVETGANRVARLLDDILDAAIIQTGDLELALHPFDVRASVESCLGMVVEEAGGKSLELSFRAEPDVPSVIIGDSRRFEQVMLALLHGGIERTERGGIGVELSCHPRGDLIELHFRVHDTGRGVPARILRSGLGDDMGSEAQLDVPGDALAIVGLSICRRLVEMMDGELRVEQGGVEKGPDAGTTFEFTILTQVMHAPAAVTQRTLEGMRVLVIAADATERRVMALQAELWGAPATVANVADALALVQAGQPFDIAIVEHRRPAIDGLALSIALRSLRSPAQLPIVLVTAAAPGPEEAGAADSGVVQARRHGPGGDAPGGFPRAASRGPARRFEGAGRRGQPAEPEHPAAPCRQARSPCRCRLERPRGCGSGRQGAIRRGPHGCVDAGDGRAAGRRSHRPALASRHAPAPDRAYCDGRAG